MSLCDPRLIDLFLQLVRLDGLSGAEHPVADYVVKALLALGYAPRIQPLPDHSQAGNVLCDVRGGGELLLLAHMDTARPTHAVRPVVRDDRICSDGTTTLGADNRAGMAVLLHVLERIAQQQLSTKPFTVAFTVCEESTLAGSFNLELPRAARMGFVFDSSLRPGHFVRASYGAMRFRVAVRGKAAHAGLAPDAGVNAIVVASKAIANLPFGQLPAETTANVGTISGRIAINVVADRVVLEGEVRSRTEQVVESQIAELRDRFLATCAAHGAVASFEANWDFHPYDIDRESPVYRTVLRAMRAAGLEPIAHESAGGSDANCLNRRGLPTVNLAIGAQNPHADSEFILLEDLQTSSDLALHLMA